jgi:hypothetical protein
LREIGASSSALISYLIPTYMDHTKECQR